MMRKYRLSLQWKFFLTIALIVFPTIGVIFVWEGIQHEKRTMDQIKNQARVLSRQIILTRQWISDCGGVMVDVKSEGARNTSCFLDDRMETSRGSYRRFTPSMVTKKLSQYSVRQDLYQFRLASLNPLNPENRPDDFEKIALTKFMNKGSTEASKFDHRDEEQYFRYIVPLYLEKGCLKCHQAREVSKSGIRGGLSVILPIAKMRSSMKMDHLKLAFSGVGLVSLMIFTLFFLLRRLVISRMKDLEEMTGKIGSGDLDARVNISTGDEVEKLGHAFNSMAESLSMGRNLLKERVKQATEDLSKANLELKGLDKLKTDFLANMSHELRSPLTVIRGGVDYLNRTIKGSENRRYLSIIDKNLSRLIHLVSDLFDFTKIEAKKGDWSFDREDVTRLLHEVIEIISPRAVEKNISINCNAQGAIYADIDLERIEQVLVNLIENAIKFSEPGTEISIDLEEALESIQVAVRDRGIGISKQSLTAIFEKFHTLPSSGGEGKREGTGLGLAISKGIVEAHGGRIWADSVKEEGSVFFFALPKKQL